jgi:hypothetical protein
MKNPPGWAGAGLSKLNLLVLVVHEQRENWDDGERNSDEPKQCAFAETHDRVLG